MSVRPSVTSWNLCTDLRLHVVDGERDVFPNVVLLADGRRQRFRQQV